MFTQSPEAIRQIANKQATDQIEARERRKKYGKSSDDGDSELAGILIVGACTA